MIRPWTIAIAGSVLVACLGGEQLAGIHARMAYSENGGLRVVDVPRGPASRAGLQEGDRILAIDGEPVEGRSTEDVVHSLRGPVGSVVEIDVLREGRRAHLEIVRMPYERR